MQRIEFARGTLRGLQLLIQLRDNRSCLVLVIMGDPSAAFFSIVGSFLGKLDVMLSPCLIVPLMAAWFLIEAGIVRWYSLKSIQGVIAELVVVEAPTMVLPHALLRRCDGDAQRYFDRLRTLEVDDILRDYAAEIVKTSNIFVEKSMQVNDAVTALFRSMLPWLIGMLATMLFRVM